MEYKELYKFCPQCKSDLKADSDHYFHCVTCGFYFYVNPIPCNAVIVENKDGEILLVKRKYDPKKGFWDVPGGFITTGETVEESIQRELNEELGAEVQNLKYFATFPDRYMYKNLNYFTLGIVFTGTITNEKLKANDDVEEIKFFKKNEIPYERIAFTSVAAGLKRYANVR